MSTHEFWMNKALKEAKKGAGMVSPNPMVGACIVSSDDQCISTGYHQHYGGPHAEVNALQSVDTAHDLSTARMYVTLEPCNHTGNTPPCTQAILDSGIRQVIVGCKDPAKHGGETGIPYLLGQGVSVEGPVLEQDCLSLNRRFFTAQLKQRPYIILKWAETRDGFMARENGDSKWISSRESRTKVHQWRAEEDCIMVGTRTAELDNPQLNVRHVDGKDPTRIVLDRSCRLPSSLHLFDGSIDTYIVTESREEDTMTAQYWSLPFNETLLHRLCNRLHDAGHLSLFVEGGSRLLHSFLEENLWDELRVFQGKDSFRQGLKAPTIPEQAIKTEEQLLDGDRITFYEHAGLHTFLQSLHT